MDLEKIKTFLQGAGRFLPKRWIYLAIGLCLIAYAQILFETRALLVQHSTKAEIWNAIYKLEIPNYDNVWAALPFLFGGILLCFLFGKLQWNEPEISGNPARTKNINWTRTVPQIFIIAALFAFLIIHLAQHRYSPIDLILWIFILAWLTWLIWKWDKQNNTDLSFGFTASDLTLILLLLLIGFAAGTFALTDVPNQIIPDEDHFWQAGRAIALGEINPPFFDIGVFTFPISTSILQGWIMCVFGVNLWGWRFSSIFAGVMAVIPLYFLGRDWFGRRVAFTAGLMILVNPYFLSFSRFGYNNSQSLFPVALAILLWEKGIRRNSIFYLWLGGLAAGLCYYSFFAAWIGVVTIGLSVIYLLLRKQTTRKRALSFFIILFAAFILMAAPRIAYGASGNKSEALVYKIFEASFVNVFYGRAYYMDSELASTHSLIPIGPHHTIFVNARVYWELLTRGTIRTLLAYLDPFIIIEHFPVSGFAGIIAPVFFVIGLALALKNWRQYRLALILLWLFGGMLFLSILNSFPPRHTHLVATIPAIALLSALGLISAANQISEGLTSRFPNYKDKLSSILSSFALLAIVFFSLKAFFIKLPVLYPAGFEDYVSWVAWRENKPLNYFYIGDTTIVHRVQRLASLDMFPGTFVNATPQNAVGTVKSYSQTPTVIFYEGTDEAIVREIQAAGYSYSVPYQKDNETVGYILTNTDAEIIPKTDIDSEFKIWLKSPALPLLGFLLAAIIVAATAGKNVRFWRGRFQVKDEAGAGSGRVKSGTEE